MNRRKAKHEVNSIRNDGDRSCGKRQTKTQYGGLDSKGKDGR